MSRSSRRSPFASVSLLVVGLLGVGLLGALWLQQQPARIATVGADLEGSSPRGPTSTSESEAARLTEPPVLSEAREERSASKAEPAAEPKSRTRPRPASRSPETIGSERWLLARILCSGSGPANGRLVLEPYSERGVMSATQAALLDADGRFRFALEPAWIGARLRLIASGQAPLDRYVVLAPGPGEQDLGEIVLASGGTLVGLVRGLPDFHGWSVTLIARDAELPPYLPRRSIANPALDPDGRFRAEHLPAGGIGLTLYHSLLGIAQEHELQVREGETTVFETTYTGIDPARALFVEVSSERSPRAGEIWLTNARKVLIPASQLLGSKVVFEGLDAGEYTLTLAMTGEEPVTQAGLVPGTKTSIVSTTTLEKTKRLKLEAEAQAAEARARRSIDWSEVIRD